MKKLFNATLLLASLAAASGAIAVQKDITVTADIDHLVNITKADGSALPDVIAMEYLPGAGKLNPHREQVKIWSNAESTDINVRLGFEAKLTNRDGAGSIPLSVALDGGVLSTTDKEFTYSELFPTGIESGSRVMALDIAQAASAPAATASGRYEGIVSIIVTQSTSTR